MQGKYCCRLCVLGIAGIMTILIAGAAIAADVNGDNKNRILATVAEPVGLVMDNRSNAYIADKLTGKIFCLPVDGELVLHGTVEGTPSALAIDRQQTLFIGTESGHVFAIKKDGSVCEACRCSSGISGLSVDRDGGLLIATTNGSITKVDRAHFIWKTRD